MRHRDLKGAVNGNGDAENDREIPYVSLFFEIINEKGAFDFLLSFRFKNK